jgi:hypothetical protein
MPFMATLCATVVKGRLVMDEPTNLPEGTVIELVPADELDEEERAALDADLEESWVEAQAGKTRPVAEVIEELHARYGGRTKHKQS